MDGSKKIQKKEKHWHAKSTTAFKTNSAKTMYSYKFYLFYIFYIQPPSS